MGIAFFILTQGLLQYSKLVPCTLCHMALEQTAYFTNSNVGG